jgi:hypothetical protein
MAQKRRVEALDLEEGFPEPLSELVRDLTARDPKRRPRNAAEVRRRLLTIRPPAREPARTEPPPEPLSVRYHQASAIGTVVTVALGAGALILFLAVAWRILAS